MKRKLFFVPFLAVLAFSSCSSDENIANLGKEDVEGDPQYLMVNLVNSSASEGSSSRAGGDQSTGNPNNATYEEGLAAENKVNSIRFYFFDAAGAPADVKKNASGSWDNYLDWSDNSDEGPNMPNVEKILNAMLIINTKAGDQVPSQIVAIINPVESAAQYSLGSVGTGNTDLYGITGDYMAKTSANFVMSNSTYKNETVRAMAVSVEGKIKKAPGEATEDPVEIYVERTVAKVRLNCTLTVADGTTNLYKTSTEQKDQKVTLNNVEKEIYVKFLGWNTTAVADKSRLVKEINPNWQDNLLGTGIPWNWAEYHRSFWAVNATGLSYRYGAFETTTAAENLFQAQSKTKFDATDYVYVNENATDDYTDGGNATTPTKVIIAAQLVDETGAPLEFAEYGSQRISIDGLKNMLANSCQLYKKTESPETYTQITPNDLKLVTATVAGEANSTTPGRYYVYAAFADETAKWYPTNTAGQTTPLTDEQAKNVLKNLGHAKVWKDGYTYYYFDINHLGNKKGVVRNHIYSATITSLSGLGTPVYDPDEIIYPEKLTDETDSYIAAQIKILSWRIVPSNITLEW